MTYAETLDETRRKMGLADGQCLAVDCAAMAVDGDATGGALCAEHDAQNYTGEINPCEDCGYYAEISSYSPESVSWCEDCMRSNAEAQADARREG